MAEKIVYDVFNSLFDFVEILTIDLLREEQKAIIKLHFKIIFQQWETLFWPKIKKWLKTADLSNPMVIITDIPEFEEMRGVTIYAMKTYPEYWKVLYEKLKMAQSIINKEV